MKVVVTGSAGFVGFHVAKRLLEKHGAENCQIVGLDNINSYYDTRLKQDRLAILKGMSGFSFVPGDLVDHDALATLVDSESPDVVIHLAAQAGVRYSIDHPFEYAKSNLVGHLSVLEACRRAKKVPRLVYASSSSVYGGNMKSPFQEEDRVDDPVSLYAATKRADELMSISYARLYGLTQIGLRFFTVYGPWGRPDMAYWSFTDKLIKGEPIPIFNNGELQRDFTYIDDVVEGVIAVATEPLHLPADKPHRIYNVGNNQPVALMRFIEVLEQAVGREAIKDFRQMQAGDVLTTFADVDALSADHGYRPKITIEEGLPRFVEWFRQRYPYGT